MVIHNGLVTDLRKLNFVSEINIGPFLSERTISRESDKKYTLLNVTYFTVS